MMPNWVFPNKDHLTAEQVNGVPICKDGQAIGRCIDADDQYIYCQIEDGVFPLTNDISSLEIMEGEVS